MHFAMLSLGTSAAQPMVYNLTYTPHDQQQGKSCIILKFSKIMIVVCFLQ